jgi:hypothetical protein
LSSGPYARLDWYLIVDETVWVERMGAVVARGLPRSEDLDHPVLDACGGDHPLSITHPGVEMAILEAEWTL